MMIKDINSRATISFVAFGLATHDAKDLPESGKYSTSCCCKKSSTSSLGQLQCYISVTYIRCSMHVLS